MTARTIEQIAQAIANMADSYEASPAARERFYADYIREAVANETATLRAQLEAERAETAKVKQEFANYVAEIRRINQGGV